MVKSNSFCGRPQRGMTLIELVAGLALVGSLLVAVLVARGRAAAQWKRAERRAAAVRVADRLLCHWWRDVAALPAPATGDVEDAPGFTWRTTVIPREAVERLGARVVRLEVSETTSPTDASPLCQVEIVLPEQRDEP